MDPTEKWRPATWWQNNGVSDLWPAINNSHFQAPILQTGVLRVRLLFISTNVRSFHFCSWAKVKKMKRLSRWQLQITWFILSSCLVSYLTQREGKKKKPWEETAADEYLWLIMEEPFLLGLHHSTLNCHEGHKRHDSSSIVRVQIDLSINMSGSQSSSHQLCHQESHLMSWAAFFSCVQSFVGNNENSKHPGSKLETSRRNFWEMNVWARVFVHVFVLTLLPQMRLRLILICKINASVFGFVLLRLERFVCLNEKAAVKLLSWFCGLVTRTPCGRQQWVWYRAKLTMNLSILGQWWHTVQLQKFPRPWTPRDHICSRSRALASIWGLTSRFKVYFRHWSRVTRVTERESWFKR